MAILPNTSSLCKTPALTVTISFIPHPKFCLILHISTSEMYTPTPAFQPCCFQPSWSPNSFCCPSPHLGLIYRNRSHASWYDQNSGLCSSQIVEKSGENIWNRAFPNPWNPTAPVNNWKVTPVSIEVLELGNKWPQYLVASVSSMSTKWIFVQKSSYNEGGWIIVSIFPTLVGTG